MPHGSEPPFQIGAGDPSSEVNRSLRYAMVPTAWALFVDHAEQFVNADPIALPMSVKREVPPVRTHPVASSGP